MYDKWFTVIGCYWRHPVEEKRTPVSSLTFFFIKILWLMENISSPGLWEECRYIPVWLPICSKARLSWCRRWNTDTEEKRLHYWLAHYCSCRNKVLLFNPKQKYKVRLADIFIAAKTRSWWMTKTQVTSVSLKSFSNFPKHIALGLLQWSKS